MSAYWIDVEPISSAEDSETDSASSEFQDSGVFSGTEDGDTARPSENAIAKNRGDLSLPTPRYTALSKGSLLVARNDHRLLPQSFTTTTKRVLSALDAASILRQSSDFLNASTYLKTSLVLTSSPARLKIPPRSHVRRSRKAPRKQSNPRRAAKRRDPTFRGVVFKFRLRFLRRRQHRLLAKSKFCCARRTRRCRYHKHGRRLSGDTSSSDSETDIANVRWHYRDGKQCASCTTRKTPLWRDAEDGTPLCNACGIRYKKYRLRCVACWYVPRKANKSCTVCLNCGDRVQHCYQRRPTPSSER